MFPEAIEAAQGLIGTALLHSVWIGLAAASVAALLARRLDSHRARHALFLAALGLVAVGSPAVAVLQSSLRSRHDGPTIGRPSIRLEIGRAVEAPSMSPPAIAPETIVETAASWSQAFRASFDESALRIQAARPYTTAAWSVGVLAAGTALMIGSVRLRRISREARPHAALDERARDFARRLRLHPVPSVRSHPTIPEPCLAGVVRPTILLPEPWLSAATGPEIDAALAHELAHARRLDHVANLMQRMIEACFFFHPCVHWLSRAARREAELCADALAARLTGDPLALAKALESVARSRPSRPRSPRLGPSLPVGGDRSTLLPRIQELLGMKPNRPRTPFWALLALPAAALVALVSASVGPAQEAPRAPGPDLSGMVDAGRLPFEADPGIATTPVPVEVLGSAPWGSLEPDAFPLTREENRLMGAAPSSLRDDELVRLVQLIRPGLADPADLPRERLLELAVVDQISFEVRYLEVSDERWAHVSRDRLKSVKGARARGAWLAEPAAMAGLLRETTRDVECRILQAPKVTTFEEARATIATGPAEDASPPDEVLRRLMDPQTAATITDHFVHTVEGLSAPQGANSLLTNVLKGGIQLQLKGRRLPKGHTISLKSAAFLPAQASAKGAAGPTAAVQRVTTEVPDGSTLVVDTGLDIALSAGAGSSPRRLRNLILVTPRHIPRERPEDVPLVAPSPDVPLAK